MVPNIDPLETGYTVTLILLMFLFVSSFLPMGPVTRGAVVAGSIVVVVGVLHTLNMLPF